MVDNRQFDSVLDYCNSCNGPEKAIVESYILHLLHSETFHLAFLAFYIRSVAKLEAPTKDSGMWYKNFFAIANASTLQWERINPHVEKSPNWRDAVTREIQNGAKKL